LNWTDWTLAEEDKEDTKEEIGAKGLLMEVVCKRGDAEIMASLVAINMITGRRVGAVKKKSYNNGGYDGFQVGEWSLMMMMMMTTHWDVSGAVFGGKERQLKDKASGECVEGNATAFWCFLFHKCFGLDNICHVITLIAVYTGRKE
jgi:hypothetical protein